MSGLFICVLQIRFLEKKETAQKMDHSRATNVHESVLEQLRLKEKVCNLCHMELLSDSIMWLGSIKEINE